jgi:phosphoenolpyruvate-protein phosphotransferase (PTS system enzyme I)
VVILARGLGLPAVSGLQNFSVILGDGQILIYGDTGEVFLNPSADTLTRYQKRLSASQINFEVFPPVPQLKVMADIGSVQDIAAALRAHTESIGRYRTEIKVLARGRPLSEEKQTERYANLLNLCPGLCVCPPTRTRRGQGRSLTESSVGRKTRPWAAGAQGCSSCAPN